MPFCHEFKKHEGEIDYEEIEACYNMLREIDDTLSSKETRIQLFGERNADKYEYRPIVRAGVDLEDTELLPTALRQIQIGAGIRRLSVL